MVQQNTDQFLQAEARVEETKQLMTDIKHLIRRKHGVEEKICIVLEVFRWDTPIRDMRLREGIQPSTYYAWLKDLMEAGKERLTRDSVHDATKAEVQDIKRENARLKQLVAELSLQVNVLQERPCRSGIKRRYVRMSARGKAEIIALVTGSELPCRRALAQLGLPKNTYYRWLKRQSEDKLEDRRGGSSLPWNKISPEEEVKVLSEARASPELSARQLAWKITDTKDIYISESMVYRILKREGLIRLAEIIGFKTANEYRRKTKRPNELWASDCCHLRVNHWGWYYLETVIDDFSRFILGWNLKTDMTGGSLQDVVQLAVDFTRMTNVPVEDRTVLLSDNGAGYISQQFNQYLRLVGIRHITALPFHPQTNGKIERYHRTLKGRINQLLYDMPSELKEAIRAFIEYYNYRRYHEGLGNVTPYNVYTGRYLEIIRSRKEVKNKTLEARRVYNRIAREQEHGL